MKKNELYTQKLKKHGILIYSLIFISLFLSSLASAQEFTEGDDIIFKRNEKGELNCDEILSRRLPRLTELRARLRCELDVITSISGVTLHQSFGVFTHGLNEKQMETTIDFLGKFIATKIDARLTVEFSNVSVGVGQMENRDEFLDFAQKKLNERLGFSSEALPNRGLSIYLEASAVPALIALELQEDGLNDLASQALWDIVEEQAKKVISIADEIRGINPKALPPGDFLVRKLFEDLSREIVQKIIRRFVSKNVHKHYTESIFRDSVKKLYVGGFRVFPALGSEDVSVYYFKVGIDEQIMKSDLTDKMVVQSVHHLAASGSALAASVGLNRTLGPDRTVKLELSTYNYKTPFNQPIFELGNHILRASERTDEGESYSAEVRYKDDTKKLDVQARVAMQDGDLAIEARYKQALPAKKLTTLYVDYAYNEKNKGNKGGEQLFGVIPVEPIQDGGATTESAFLVALDRQIYKKGKNEIHITGYYTHEKGGVDLLRSGIRQVKERDALGLSLSYAVRRMDYDFNSVFGFELNRTHFEDQKETDEITPTFILGGGFEFNSSSRERKREIEKEHILKTARQYTIAIKKFPKRELEFTKKLNDLAEAYPGYKEEILKMIEDENRSIKLREQKAFRKEKP